jgi:CheY-like chemotaxis protein
MSADLTGVIIADDDPMIRAVLRAQFEAIDLDVFLASDGAEAVAIAGRIRPALVILDLRMPHMNGLLCCEHIRRQPGNAATPIVVLTSTTGPECEAAAARVGANAYFAKPFRAALLLHDVARFLPIADAARDAIRRAAQRAREIAEVSPASGRALTATPPLPDRMLDRNKTILDVLRG